MALVPTPKSDYTHLQSFSRNWECLYYKGGNILLEYNNMTRRIANSFASQLPLTGPLTRSVGIFILQCTGVNFAVYRRWITAASSN